MATSNGKDKGVALAKRAKIDSAQRNMFIAVALASVVLGVTAVGAIYLVRTIIFNINVSAAKDEVIEEYKKAQKSLTELTNKVSELAKNERLEVVARARSQACENSTLELDAETSTSYAVEDIELARTCSALRVIPDALPALYNEDSSRASMVELLKRSNGGEGVTAEAVTGEKAKIKIKDLPNVGGVTTSIRLNDEASKVSGALTTIENSIRNYDIKTATISWSGDRIELRAVFTGYYSNSASVETETKLICADENSDTCIKEKGKLKKSSKK